VVPKGVGSPVSHRYTSNEADAAYAFWASSPPPADSAEGMWGGFGTNGSLGVSSMTTGPSDLPVASGKVAPKLSADRKW